MKVAVITPVKLENRYLQEFVGYYFNLGFTTVILADNNNIDGERLEEVLEDYINSGFVRVENFRGREHSWTLQNEINQVLWNKYNQDYDWVAIFDADEYLELDSKYKSISDFLSLDRFSGVDEIRFSWKLYGDAGMIKPIGRDYSVESRFKRESNVSPLTYSTGQTKAILRGKRPLTFPLDGRLCAHHGVNIPEVRQDVDVLGMPLDHTSVFRVPPVLEEAWINHYNTKTLSEFVFNKVYRGVLDETGYCVDTYVNINSWWTKEEIVKILEQILNVKVV